MLSSFNVVLQTARLAQRMNKALRSVGGESISLPLKIVSINKSCNTNGLSVGQVLVLELGRKTQELHEPNHPSQITRNQSSGTQNTITRALNACWSNWTEFIPRPIVFWVLSLRLSFRRQPDVVCPMASARCSRSSRFSCLSRDQMRREKRSSFVAQRSWTACNPPHGRSELLGIGTYGLSHSLIRTLVRSHRSLVCSFYTSRFARALHSAALTHYRAREIACWWPILKVL